MQHSYRRLRRATGLGAVALLAVPLTATMKVLLKRYFWDRPGAGLISPPESSGP